LPSGARIRSIAQESNGSQVAIIEVRSLVSSATVEVTGDRPLIIYARQSIDIASGVIDAGADGTQGGPGARTTGSGLGQTGTHAGRTAMVVAAVAVMGPQERKAAAQRRTWEPAERLVWRPVMSH
jgi:hypothetical protein